MFSVFFSIFFLGVCTNLRILRLFLLILSRIWTLIVDALLIQLALHERLNEMQSSKGITMNENCVCYIYQIKNKYSKSSLERMAEARGRFFHTSYRRAEKKHEGAHSNRVNLHIISLVHIFNFLH